MIGDPEAQQHDLLPTLSRRHPTLSTPVTKEFPVTQHVSA